MVYEAYLKSLNCIHVCTYTCRHTHIYVCICIYVCVCGDISIYICKHTQTGKKGQATQEEYKDVVGHVERK